MVFHLQGLNITSQLPAHRGVSTQATIRQLEIVSWKPAASLFPSLRLRGWDSRVGWEASCCGSRWQRPRGLVSRWCSADSQKQQDASRWTLFVAESFPGAGTGEFCKDLNGESKPLEVRSTVSPRSGLFYFRGGPSFAVRMVATWYLQTPVWSLLEKLEQKLCFFWEGSLYFSVLLLLSFLCSCLTLRFGWKSGFHQGEVTQAGCCPSLLPSPPFAQPLLLSAWGWVMGWCKAQHRGSLPEPHSHDVHGKADDGCFYAQNVDRFPSSLFLAD